QRRIGLEEDRAALTAVAPVGAAARDELFATEADAAGAAVAALDEDVDLVDEHRRTARPPGRRSGRLGQDADVTRVAAALELDHAVDLREQRAARAEPDVAAGPAPAAGLAAQGGS